MRRKNNNYILYILIIIVILVLLVLIYYTRPLISNFQSNNGYDIVIIAGQSNAVGRGLEVHTFPKSDGYNPMNDTRTRNMYKDDYDNTANSNICALNQNNTIQQNAVDPIQHLEPYPFKRQNRPVKNFGFAVSFAREYIRQGKLASGRKLLLVGCGRGQTGFKDKQWLRPNGELYKSTIIRGQQALALGNKDNNKIIAILWHQGENDIKHRTKPNFDYKKQLSECLNGIRDSIVKKNPTSVPILLGGLIREKGARDDMTENYIRVTTELSSNKNFKFVPSKPMSEPKYNNFDLFNHSLLADKDTGDNHFSKSSQIEFGKRYFYIFNNNKFDVQN